VQWWITAALLPIVLTVAGWLHVQHLNEVESQKMHFGKRSRESFLSRAGVAASGRGIGGIG
jgi:hypothetical protein